MSSVGHPINVPSIQPCGENVLVVKYERPAATPSGLIIPEPFRIDPFWAYWEVVAAGPDVEKALGIALTEGSIIRTPFRPAIDSGFENSCGRRLYFVSCSVQQWDAVSGKMQKVSNILGIIPNTWTPKEE